MSNIACRAAFIIAVLAGLLVSVAPAGAADAVFSLRLGYWSKSGDERAEAARSIAEALGAGGRVSAELVPMEEPRALFRDVQSGRLDMALVDAWTLGDAVPSLGFLAMPFTFAVDNRTAKFFNSAGIGRLNEVLSPSGVAVVRWFKLETPVLLGGEFFLTKDAFRGASVSGIANPFSERFAEAVGAVFQPTEANGLLAGTSGRKRAVIVTLSAIAAKNTEPVGQYITELPGFDPYLAVCVPIPTQSQLEQVTEGAFSEMVASAVGRVERDATAAASAAYLQLMERGYPFQRLDEDEAREARKSLGVSQGAVEDEVLMEAVRTANQHDMVF